VSLVAPGNHYEIELQPHAVLLIAENIRQTCDAAAAEANERGPNWEDAVEVVFVDADNMQVNAFNARARDWVKVVRLLISAIDPQTILAAAPAAGHA
jgi:hypothetical protein